MPIYEYVCLDCGDQFEIMRAMKDADEPISCRKCEGGHIARMLSMFNAQSGGRSIAGAGGGCTSCSNHACSTCGSR